MIKNWEHVYRIFQYRIKLNLLELLQKLQKLLLKGRMLQNVVQYSIVYSSSKTSRLRIELNRNEKNVGKCIIDYINTRRG